ncbi:MAG: hypothetical protein EB084_10100 [Proteobacteria bacterium]|nr:hypothetical protein [Pseudomonadota bacterium]
MFEALRVMAPTDLLLAAHMAGLQGDATATDPAAYVIKRLAERLSVARPDLRTVGEACFEYLSGELGGVSLETCADPAARADELFQPLLALAVRDLAPLWRAPATMLAVQEPSHRRDVIKVLERVFVRVLPSEVGLLSLRESTEAVLPDRAVASGFEAGRTAPFDTAIFASRPAWVRPALSIALVLACADGKFTKEEERLYFAMADRFEVSHGAATRLRDQLIAAYWSRRAHLAPASTEQPAEVRVNSLRAAYDVLEGAGVYTELAGFTCQAAVRAAQQALASQRASWSQRVFGGLLGRERIDPVVLQIALLCYICAPTEGAPA